MVGALAKMLATKGHQVGVVTPLYAGIRERFPQIKPLDYWLEVPLGPQRVRGAVGLLEAAPNRNIYFIENDRFFNRQGLYHPSGVDFPDNAVRFIFFSKATAKL